jgi:hypothetical protein
MATDKKISEFEAASSLTNAIVAGIVNGDTSNNWQFPIALFDSRYYTQAALGAGALDSRYYTETELNAGQLDGRYYTETEVNAQFAALGTAAAADIGDFATAAQGALADTALQSADVGTAAALDVGTAVGDIPQLEDVGGGTPGLPPIDGSQLTGLPGGGDMVASVYDPQTIVGDAFDTDNHTDGSTNGVYTLAERAKLAATGDRLTGTASVPGTILAAQFKESFDVTVTGAVVADKVVSVVLPSALAADADLYGPIARVTAPDTVTVWLANLTAYDKTGLSGTATVTVEVS